MRVFALLGTMGTGKTTIYNKLIEKGFVGIKEMTTRPIRLGEQNNQQYIFVTDDEYKKHFQQKLVIASSSFIISSGDVYKYGFNVYSLPIDIEQDCVVQANYQNITDLKEFYGDRLVSIKLERKEDSIMQSVNKRGDNTDEILRRLRKDVNIYKNVKTDYIFNEMEIDECVCLINKMR